MPTPFTYEMKKGDNPSVVAKRFGLSLPSLMALNNLTEDSARKIKIGQTLLLKDIPPVKPAPKAAGPSVADFTGRGLPAVSLPQTDPVGAPGGSQGTSMVSRPPVQFNPTVHDEAPDASALAPAKQWTAGQEIPTQPQELQIPVEVKPQDPPPKPVSGPQEPSMLEKAHSYLDPVAALSGHAGDTGYSPSMEDYIRTALMGLGGGGARPVDLEALPAPARSVPGKAVARALAPVKNPNHPWYKPRPWDNPVEERLGLPSRVQPDASNIEPLDISPFARAWGGRASTNVEDRRNTYDPLSGLSSGIQPLIGELLAATNPIQFGNGVGSIRHYSAPDNSPFTQSIENLPSHPVPQGGMGTLSGEDAADYARWLDQNQTIQSPEGSIKPGAFHEGDHVVGQDRTRPWAMTGGSPGVSFVPKGRASGGKMGSPDDIASMLAALARQRATGTPQVAPPQLGMPPGIPIMSPAMMQPGKKAHADGGEVAPNLEALEALRKKMISQQADWNPQKRPISYTQHAKGGALPATLPKALPKAKGVPPQSVMVSRGAGSGMAHSKSGFLHSSVPGRTDKLSLNVQSGSYVIPADVVAGHGQGNSLAGAAALDKLFKSGPYGSGGVKVSTPKSTMPKVGFVRPQTTNTGYKRAWGGGMPGGSGSIGKGSQSGGGDQPAPPPGPQWQTGVGREGPMSAGIGYGSQTYGGFKPNSFGNYNMGPQQFSSMFGGNMPKGVENVTMSGKQMQDYQAQQQQKQFDLMMKQWQGNQEDPAVQTPPAPGQPPAQQHMADGGAAQDIPVNAAGGEYIIPPEAVSSIGGGNVERGFRTLDQFVLQSRKKQVKEISKLKPPRKD